MDWTVWLMFVLTEGALTVTPGPAVLFVASQSLRSGSDLARWAAVGILAVNTSYFACSATGVGAALAASGRLFAVFKWAGACYLLYLGARALLRPPHHPEARVEAGGASGRRRLFLRGFVLQLSNPKALLFFIAILPQFIDRGRPIVFQILVLGITSIVLEFVVLAAYAAAAAHARTVIDPRFAIVSSRLSGVLLVGAALGLARTES